MERVILHLGAEEVTGRKEDCSRRKMSVRKQSGLGTRNDLEVAKGYLEVWG